MESIIPFIINYNHFSLPQGQEVLSPTEFQGYGLEAAKIVAERKAPSSGPQVADAFFETFTWRTGKSPDLKGKFIYKSSMFKSYW